MLKGISAAAIDTKSKKDSLLQLNVKSVDGGDYIYSGRTRSEIPCTENGQKLETIQQNNDTADVYIEDPQGNKLFQFKGVQLGKGIAEMKFPLADEPVHGTWRIFLSDEHDSPSTTFDVKEYKLPKFISVCAEYTYGEPVTGTLNLNTSLEIYSYQSSYSRTPILHNSVEINGCYNYTINVDSIDPDRRFNYKRVQVTANVTEKGTGIQKVETKYLERSYSPLKLDFNTDENHGKYYKPGLPYKGKLKVTNPDNSPAPQEPVEICATVSRKRVIDTWLANKKIKYCRNFTSDANGYIHYTIVPQNTDSVSIDLNAKSLKYTEDDELDHPTDSAYLDPFYSPSGSFIQLETISKPIPCGTQKNIRLLFTARKNTQFKLIYQVLKKGKVTYTGSQDINFKVQDDVSSKYEKDDEIINASETQLVPKLPPSSSSSSSESTSGEENCPSTRDARYVLL
ncbi:alpha-2-macroglobulin [Caerostris extrusa]|uniref:Alpha-2-macroglobulin n=1 Tax=Caerostris extrusa TaxID=172846 RepID=A0AAV4NTA7_CAEEX|nr:alpha-2-macroglobulin [Caerostris extrusa]